MNQPQQSLVGQQRKTTSNNNITTTSIPPPNRVSSPTSPTKSPPSTLSTESNVQQVISEAEERHLYQKPTSNKKACSECSCGAFDPVEFVMVRCNKCFHMKKAHNVTITPKHPDHIYTTTVTADDTSIASGSSADHRAHIVHEILVSERTYIDLLQACIEGYMVPVRSTNEPLIPIEKMNTIFGNYSEILQLNTILLSGLEEKMAKWTSQKEVGEAPYMTIYNNYSEHFEMAMATLEDCEKNAPAFSAFLRASGNDPCCKGQALKTLLALPLQRVPRYLLFLEALQESTPKDHSDFPNLVSIIEMFKVSEYFIARITDYQNVATHISDSLRAQENQKKLCELQVKLNMSNYNINLPERHRLFLRDGLLSKVCRKATKKRHFFLFSDLLIYGRFMVSEFILHRVVPLDSLHIDDVPDNDRFSNAFKVTSAQKSFVVLADTKEEKMKWMMDLYSTAEKLRVMRDNIAKQQLPTSPSVAATPSPEPKTNAFEAPIWQSDSDTTRCNICLMEFSLFNRRHHCRLCGKIVCNTCSPNRVILPQISDTDKQRVCANCNHERIKPGNL